MNNRPGDQTMKHLITVLALVGFAGSATWAAEPGSKDYRPTPEHPVGYRGDGSGYYPGAHPVTTWDVATGKNIVWKTELPTWSHAHPVIVGDKVYALGEPHFVYCLDAATGKILWQDTLDHIDLMDEKTKAEARKVEAMQNDWAAMQNVGLVGGRLYYTFYVGQNGYRGRRNADPMGPWNEGGVGPNGSDAQKAINQQWIAKYGLEKSIATCHKEWFERYDLAIRNWVSWTGYTYPPVVSDGEHVYVSLGNNQAACYTLDGKRVWARWHKITSEMAKHPLPYGARGSSYGYAHYGSNQLVPAPILCDGLLVDCRNQVVRAIDAKTGELKWWRLRLAADNGKGAERRGGMTSPCSAFTGSAVAHLTWNGKVVAVLITGDGFAYRLEDGTPLLEPRTTPMPRLGKGENPEEYAKKGKAVVGKSFATLLPDTASPASAPVANKDKLYLRAASFDHVCGITLKFATADKLEWVLDWAQPLEEKVGGRDLMVSTDRIYAGSQVIEKATGKVLAAGRSKGLDTGYGNLLLVGDERIFSGGEGKQGVYDAKTFQMLGEGSFNLNPKEKKGIDLTAEQQKEFKRAGILMEHRRLNFGSFATFSGNRTFARTQWGVYCIGDPKAEWK